MPYHCVWVSTSGRVSMRWSKPLETAQEAGQMASRKVDSGEASLAFVVEISEKRTQVSLGRTRPASAAKIIQHYLDLLEELRLRE